MINSIWEALLRWRWLVTALIGLTVVISEMVEHDPAGLSDLGLNLLSEPLSSGVALPLIVGVMLGILAHTKSKPIQTTTTSIVNTKDRGEQRVLVVENESLLGAGIESLLTLETDLDLVGIAPSNEAELIQGIMHFQPQVIILDETTHLTNSIRLLDQLKNYPELRLVVVNANSNLVHLYDKQELLVSQATDLANVIRR